MSLQYHIMCLSHNLSSHLCCFVVESLAVKCADETKSQRVCDCLYSYYMLTEQMDKVKQLTEVHHVIEL